MESATTTDIRTRRIEYDRLGVSALFSAYIGGEEKALRYFAHNPWEAKARGEAARIAAEHPCNRELVADVLLGQNERWWGGEEKAVRDNIEKLRDAESVVVVTGQQLGLFGGPLYTFYKALTAVKLAEQLARETGRSVAPIFWLADEDHDYAEVHATTLPNGAEPIRVAYEDGLLPEMNRGPVGRIVLGERMGTTVDQLFAAFPQAPDWVREVWRPGELWRDAFAHTLRGLTKGTGLVFVSADDARLKRLAAPIFRREIGSWSDSFDKLAVATDGLVNDGFHVQVKPGPVNLFLFSGDGERLPIDPDGDGFVLRGTRERFSREELLDLVEAHPVRFSPNVVLRPVMQDTLLPTAAYVAGPGEIAYFAQLKPIYEVFGVPMPVIYPRASLTLVSGKLQRFLDEYGLELPDLKEDIHELHRRLTLERSDAGLYGQFADAARQARALVEVLKPIATSVDSSLDKAVEAAQAKVEKALTRLEAKTIRAEKRNQHVILERLERLVGELMPGGVPQERVMCALMLLRQLTPGELLATLVDETLVHHFVEI